MIHTERRFLSAPVGIEWAGWQSDTFRLQQAGWEISAEEDLPYGALRLALRHRDLQMYGLSRRVSVDFFHAAREPSIVRGLVVPIAYMATRLTAVVHDNLSSFNAIDAIPQYTEVEHKDIEDFKIFATPLARTNEIIVDPKDVSTLLDMIREVQLPEQDAIRARNTLRESRKGPVVDSIPRQHFHAQILSVA